MNITHALWAGIPLLMLVQSSAFGEIRMLTDAEMKATTGGWPFQRCSGGGTCPSSNGCTGATCTLHVYFNQCDMCPICPGCNCVNGCTISGSSDGCTNGGATYKVCRAALCVFCNSNNSGSTPCGSKIRPRCWTTGCIMGCFGPGCTCFCNTGSGSCGYSDCT